MRNEILYNKLWKGKSDKIGSKEAQKRQLDKGNCLKAREKNIMENDTFAATGLSEKSWAVRKLGKG